MTERAGSATPHVHSRLRLLSLINVVAGLWLIAAPFVLALPHTYPHQKSFLNLLLSGTVILALSVLHGLQWSYLRRASWGTVILGGWLVVSPVIFGVTKHLTNGRTVALVSAASGLVVVAGGALCLAGSSKGTDDETVTSMRDTSGTGTSSRLGASSAESLATVAPSGLAHPVLWGPPSVGEQPVAYRGRADGGAEGEIAPRRNTPLIWASVAGLILAAVLLGLALILHSWLLTAGGVLLALTSGGLAHRARILSDVSVTQSPTGR